MKKFTILLSSFVVLSLLFSCERTIPDVRPTTDPFILTDPYILYDFKTRCPSARIFDISNRDDGKTIILFTDADGLEGVTIYIDGTWMITEKTFNTDDFLYKIPRKVARTYIGTGIENEDYNGDSYYVVEISRNGMTRKQYEFVCSAPFVEGSRLIDNLLYNIVIDEDGTLLTCSHTWFNRSIWWYDIRTSIECVRNKYGDVPILGAVNDGGNNVLFIRDHDIIKTVTLRDRGYGYEWQDTRYPLNMNTVLPASVLADRKRYEAEHPEEDFYALSSIDCPEGLFYGLTFGTELTNTTIFSRADFSQP